MTFTYFVSAADWGRIAPELVLVGMTLLIMLVDLLLPRAGDSSPSAKLAERVSIPRGRQRHTHARRRRPRQEIDALAAAVLLQDYLDHHRNKIEDTHL